MSGTLGPHIIQGLGVLELEFLTLSFAGNNFNGSIPDFLAQLDTAEHLRLARFDLHSNMFSGSLPASFLAPTSSFSRFAVLSWNLNNNMISGTVPSSLLSGGPFLQEIILDLSNNALEGSLPVFVNLTRTDSLELHLSGNNLAGTIPSQFWSTFDDANILIVEVLLAGCRLAGSIPTIPLDMTVNLDNNSLTFFSIADTLASSRATIESTIISIQNNKLEGVLNFPASSTPTKLQLYVNNNSLSELVVNGDISNYLTALDVSDNVDLVGTIPSSFLSNTSSVEVLRARNTSMSGEFPNISYELTSQLRELVLSNSGIDFCNGSRIGWLKSDLTVCDLNNTTAVRCAQAYPSQCSIGGSAPPIYGPHGSPARPSSPTTSGPEPIRVPTGASSQVMTSIYTSVIALMSYFILL